MPTKGQRIYEVRKNNKLTQSSFGEVLGISQTHVSKIEKDIENPSETLLRFISHRFAVNLDWLRTGDGACRLELGSSTETTINRYRQFSHDFEQQMLIFTTDQLWNSVDAYCALISSLTVPFVRQATTRESINYLHHIKEIQDCLMIITLSASEIACSRKKNPDYKEILSLREKCDRLTGKINTSITEMVSDMLNLKFE